MEIELSLEITTPSTLIAETVVKSVSIEVNSSNEIFDRSRIKLNSVDEKILVIINSQDITSAKASINTCLKWIENSLNIVEKYQIN